MRSTVLKFALMAEEIPYTLRELDDMLRDVDVRLLWIEAKLGVPISQADRIIAEDAARKRWGSIDQNGPWSLSPLK
jgi:hypothetical protein